MKKYYEKIRNNGLKVTPRRKKIIQVFADKRTHMTAEDVWSSLKNEFKKCGLPSVYRNLDSLTECGVLTRIQKFDGKKHYSLCPAGEEYHHHHIVCVKCGKVDAVKELEEGKLKSIKGYKVLSHFLQVNGICEECL